MVVLPSPEHACCVLRAAQAGALPVHGKIPELGTTTADLSSQWGHLLPAVQEAMQHMHASLHDLQKAPHP